MVDEVGITNPPTLVLDDEWQSSHGKLVGTCRGETGFAIGVTP